MIFYMGNRLMIILRRTLLVSTYNNQDTFRIDMFEQVGWEVSPT